MDASIAKDNKGADYHEKKDQQISITAERVSAESEHMATLQIKVLYPHRILLN